MTIIETPRLTLRQWSEYDQTAFAQMNADPTVMRYFPAPLSRSESDALMTRLQALIEQNGYGFWALEHRETQALMGFVGLNDQAVDSGFPVTPLTEIGWRLAASYWGQGYAPEAAEAVLAWAWQHLSLDAVYAFTTLSNQPSRRVMEKIGMSNTHMDFDHPRLAADHPLARHCFYRIARPES